MCPWLGTGVSNWRFVLHHMMLMLGSKRGTSPSPREVFDRATFPSPHPLWIPAFPGITMALRRPHKRLKMVGRRPVQRGRTSGAHWAGDEPQRYNPLSPPLWIPAFAGMTKWGAGLTKGCRK